MIHIVQKGDTLWEISKKYGVDFEQVKQLNPQLSSPDMIMPGMKIKIPSTSKPVKKEKMEVKETKEHKVEHPYKDISPKPMPVIEEDDYKVPKEVMPKEPAQKPTMEQPKMQMPPMPKPTMEQPKMQQPMVQMPMMEQDQDMVNYTTINLPDYQQPHGHPAKQQGIPYQPQVMPLPMFPVPVCCHCFPPCSPSPMNHGFPHDMKQQDCGCGSPMPMPHHGMKQQDCGCGSPMPMPHHGMKQQDCGYGSPMPMPHHGMKQQDYGYGTQIPMPYHDTKQQDCGYGSPTPMPYPTLYRGMESTGPSTNTEMPKGPMPNQQMYGQGFDAPPIPPQNNGMQQDLQQQHTPPQFYPNFTNTSNNEMPHPAPPEFRGEPAYDFRKDEDE